MPPRDPRRADRVGEAVREEVAAFLTRDAKDPRLTGLVTVTAVEMARDLRHATIFVSVLGDDAAKAITIEVLAGMAPHLRGRVGRALRLQFAPELTFRLDESVQRAARIETLLAQLKRDEGLRAAGREDAIADGDADADRDVAGNA
jgi:ribosome-binding factor A